MRKLFIAIALVMGMCSATAQEQGYKVDGNTYTSINTKSVRDVRSNAEQTTFTWQDSKGTSCPIWVASTGSCFVIRRSERTGNEYRQYLGREISADVCKRMGREYKPTNKTRK